MMNYDASAKVTAKVGDFGLARHVDPKLYEALGTWQWLAPGTCAHAFQLRNTSHPRKVWNAQRC